MAAWALQVEADVTLTSSSADGGGATVIESPHTTPGVISGQITPDPGLNLEPGSTSEPVISGGVSVPAGELSPGTVQVHSVSSSLETIGATVLDGGATVDFVEMPELSGAGLDADAARSNHVSALIPGAAGAVGETAAGAAAIRGGHLLSP